MNSLSTQDAGKVVHLAGKYAVAVVSAMLFLAGCAGMPGRAPEEVVKERAQARWDDMVKGDFHAAYAYMSPSSRQLTSENDWMARLRRGFWKSAQVEKVECKSANACDVSVTIDYEFQGMRTRTPLHESWVREGSQWWYVLRG